MGCDIMVVLRNTISHALAPVDYPRQPLIFSFARLVLHVSWHGSSGIERRFGWRPSGHAHDTIHTYAALRVLHVQFGNVTKPSMLHA
jgi:hypothetical protein